MSPPKPSLHPVFTIEAQIAPPQSAGAAPHGERLHIPITGGRVHGTHLTGEVLPGGSDWPVIGPDGNSRIHACYTIRADDGTLIYVVNRGLRVSSDDVLRRLRAGHAVDPSEVYMRAAPVFDAPDGKHAWLRERLFICSLLPSKTSVEIDVYVVE